MFIAVRDGNDDYSLWSTWSECKYSQAAYGYRRSRFRFKPIRPERGNHGVCMPDSCEEPFCQDQREKCTANLYRTAKHKTCKWTSCKSKTVCHNQYSSWKGYGIRKLVSRSNTTELCPITGKTGSWEYCNTARCSISCDRIKEKCRIDIKARENNLGRGYNVQNSLTNIMIARCIYKNRESCVTPSQFAKFETLFD